MLARYCHLVHEREQWHRWVEYINRLHQWLTLKCIFLLTTLLMSIVSKRDAQWSYFHHLLKSYLIYFTVLICQVWDSCLITIYSDWVLHSDILSFIHAAGHEFKSIVHEGDCRLIIIVPGGFYKKVFSCNVRRQIHSPQHLQCFVISFSLYIRDDNLVTNLLHAFNFSLWIWLLCCCLHITLQHNFVCQHVAHSC